MRKFIVLSSTGSFDYLVLVGNLITRVLFSAAKTVLFTNDANFFISATNNMIDCGEQGNFVLDKVKKWFTANKLHINFLKTNSVYISIKNL